MLQNIDFRVKLALQVGPCKQNSLYCDGQWHIFRGNWCTSELKFHWCSSEIIQPVFAGEIQTRGLGMQTDVLDEDGTSLIGKQGELCCTAPFPAMPVKFWNDADGSKYKAAYFEHFQGIWRHGDWATMTARGGMIIHGRSDATLNPGGVRIGTAEIYRQVEAFDAITEALVIGQDWQDDVRVILFVRMADGANLDDDLRRALNPVRDLIRMPTNRGKKSHVTPRQG